MKYLIFLLCCSIGLHAISTSGTEAATIVPARTPTYTVAITPVVTPHSHQVVARNYNRWYVPAGSYVPASYVPTAYPYYYPTTTTTAYSYGYGYYPAYGYSYGYGTAVPTALWR